MSVCPSIRLKKESFDGLSDDEIIVFLYCRSICYIWALFSPSCFIHFVIWARCCCCCCYFYCHSQQWFLDVSSNLYTWVCVYVRPLLWYDCCLDLNLSLNCRRILQSHYYIKEEPPKNHNLSSENHFGYILWNLGDILLPARACFYGGNYCFYRGHCCCYCCRHHDVVDIRTVADFFSNHCILPNKRPGRFWNQNFIENFKKDFNSL